MGLEGPIREGATGSTRVRVRVVKDGAEGWATVRGNRGTAFLKEGGSSYRVVTATILTEAINPTEKTDGEAECPKLTIGEVLDVLEGPRKEESSGLTRLRVKVRSTGSEGWATARGSQGAIYCKAMA